MFTKARELAPSVVRTVTPYVVGAIVTLLGKLGFDWSPTPEELVLVTGVVSALYYGLVRILETRGSQAWGWLLGVPKPPIYIARGYGDGIRTSDPTKPKGKP